MRAKKTAIVVDPHSSGAYYASEFKKHGIACMAILSIEPPAHFSRDFDQSSYSLVLSPGDDYLLFPPAEDIVAVVAGCDTGVVLADQLSKNLGLDGNDPETSLIRRDKHRMQVALQMAGVRHIPTMVFNSFEDFSRSSEFFDETPFVVKPVNSAGSEGVRFVEGRHGLASAMKDSAWNRVNVLGELNRGFVIQSFVGGPEFVVDMVAMRGRFFVTSVGRCFKTERNGSRFVCESVEMLDPKDTELCGLLEYARDAARCLARLGPVHMELKWGLNGPVMIEASTRLPGAGLPLLYSQIYKPDLLSAAVLAHLGKPISDDVDALCSTRQRFGRMVCLISDTEREYGGLMADDETRLRMLESYWSHKLYVREGDTLVKTVDFATCPGLVFLTHENAQRLIEDEKEVRNIFSGYLQAA